MTRQRLCLPQVTLCCVDTRCPAETVHAHCTTQIYRLACALHRKKPPAGPKLKELVRPISMLGDFIVRQG